MALQNFHNKLFCRIFDTSEEINCGAFQVTDNQELRHIRVLILIYGGVPTTETLTLKLHSESSLSSLYATSDSISLSDVAQTTNYWIGYVRFDFDRINLNKNNTYWVNITTGNYTRNSNTYYLGYVFDWPVGTYNDDTTTPMSNANMQIFGYRETT